MTCELCSSEGHKSHHFEQLYLNVAVKVYLTLLLYSQAECCQGMVGTLLFALVSLTVIEMPRSQSGLNKCILNK